MFKNLKRNMDIELDLTIKAIMQKSAESNEFFRFVIYLKTKKKKENFNIHNKFRTDVEKCLQTMLENVTLQKALQALIAGGAR
jgi:hypothetical protein